MCNMVVEPCVNGVCINMPGNEFRCECDIGFLVSEDQQDCVGKLTSLFKSTHVFKTEGKLTLLPHALIVVPSKEVIFSNFKN